MERARPRPILSPSIRDVPTCTVDGVPTTVSATPDPNGEGLIIRPRPRPRPRGRRQPPAASGVNCCLHLV